METDSTPSPTKLPGLWKTLRFGFLLLIVPLILLFVFGFFIKTTTEYTCMVDLLNQDPQVEQQIGHPLKWGLFAWMPYFESGGGVRQGAFSTSISGPFGRGKVQVQFYSSPIGDSFLVLLETKASETTIHEGSYPCP